MNQLKIDSRGSPNLLNSFLYVISCCDVAALSLLCFYAFMLCDAYFFKLYLQPYQCFFVLQV